MVQVFARFIMRVRRGISWLIKQEGSPGERARGLAVGVFSGCFPFFGFQTFLGIILAYFLKVNHLLEVAGTWISNPITYIPLFWINYKVGSFMLGQATNDQFLNQFSFLPVFLTDRILQLISV